MQIVKRTGELTEYSGDKIKNAIRKAMAEGEGIDERIVGEIESEIRDEVGNEFHQGLFTVEMISDMAEDKLLRKGFINSGRRFILYRREREKVRSRVDKKKYKYLSQDFLSEYKHGKEPFTTEVGKFTYLRTYSRILPEESRREEFWESVARVVDYNIGLAKWKTYDSAVREAEQLFDNIYNLRQFPSGRALFSGGTPTSYLNPISQYNCSFAVFDNFDIVKDITYLLMLGVGFGFSVEKQYVDLLPKIRGNIKVVHKSYDPVPKKMRKEATEFNITDDIIEIIVGDSKIAWSNALDMVMKVFYQLDYAHVNAIIINYDNVRLFNEPLKTFGGFSSGHTALQIMIEKISKVLLKDNQSKKKLKPIDCMDIANIIAEGIVVGGTRRSAESCLISHDDKETQEAKMSLYTQDADGNWVVDKNILHRMMSNNSTAYWGKPSKEELKQRFEIIKHSAENNFFNMESARKRKPNVKGTNPLTL
jgi:adenosylcobalamin-dependent ribonucleoside-triphosphate reductase